MATERDLLVKIKGDTRDFEKAMKGVTKHSGDASMSFSKMAGAVAAGQAIFSAATVAFSKATQFISGSVKDYMEAEKSAKQLQHAVLDVTHATKAQLKATNDLADSLSRKGVLDDDVIRMGQAQLSTFGLSNKSVQKLSKAMADLTVNQFGVNASGEQAVTAANIMAKALNGNFGALEKMGIHLTDTQRKLIKFGDETKRVKTINEVLAANLRTNQATALETTEGKIAHLRVAYGNLREKIGELTVKALTPLVSKLAEFASKVNWDNVLAKAQALLKAFWGQLKQVYDVISKIVTRIGKYLEPKFVALWHSIEQIMPTIIRLWREVLQPLAKVIGVVLVGAVGLLIDQWNLMLKVLDPVIRFLLDNKPVLYAFVGGIAAIALALKISTFVNQFQAGMAAVRGAIVATQTTLATPMVMPAIVIAAAVASLAQVVRSINAVKQAVKETNEAAKSAAAYDPQRDAVEQIKLLKQRAKTGKTAAIRARAQKQLDSLLNGGGYMGQPKGYATGGFTGAGAANQVAGVVHKGEYVVPKQDVDQATGTPKMGGVNITVNMGMYAGMPVEKRQIALDIYRELVRAARANGVSLPIIPQAGVQ